MSGLSNDLGQLSQEFSVIQAVELSGSHTPTIHQQTSTSYCDEMIQSSSSSRMRVMNHNWSATKQHLHPQSVAEISRHSVLSGDRIRQCGTGTSSGSRHKDTDQCMLVAVSFCRHRSVPVPYENGSAETTVAEGGRK